MTEPVSNTVRRPGSVTIVVVLTIISGILTLLGALFLLLLGGAASLASNISGVAVLVFGILYLIFGIVTIAVGVGLRNGSRFARILVTILMVIDILGGIANLIWFRSNQTVTSAIITIIVSVVVLALLYNRRASEFFAHTPAA
ncbi:MAG TPA: hypothetical protein VJW23_18990 [Propionibacteriaceae bacterium]|nr:hypothetical protein [Propionibacteriaceae bacterium]